MMATQDQILDDNAEQIESAQYRQAARNQRMIDLFRENPVGQQVLEDILQETGAFTSHEPSDIIEMAFDAGKRQTGLWILTCMGEGPQGVIDRFMKNRERLL